MKALIPNMAVEQVISKYVYMHSRTNFTHSHSSSGKYMAGSPTMIAHFITCVPPVVINLQENRKNDFNATKVRKVGPVILELWVWFKLVPQLQSRRSWVWGRRTQNATDGEQHLLRGTEQPHLPLRRWFIKVRLMFCWKRRLKSIKSPISNDYEHYRCIRSDFDNTFSMTVKLTYKTNSVHVGTTILLLHFCTKKPPAATLNSYIALQSKFNRRKREGTQTWNSKMVNNPLKRYATDKLNIKSELGSTAFYCRRVRLQRNMRALFESRHGAMIAFMMSTSIKNY